ncbi:MAG: glycosyl hydrolase, partial [Bacteroidota bacterium]
DPLNPSIIYGSDFKGYISMQNLANGQERSTNVWPELPAGSGAEVMKYRFNWNYPLVFSPHDPKKLYAGSNHLHVSYNGGQSWEVISPDLTRNIPETIRSSGGPITQDNTGAEYYANLFVITESPYTRDEIWTGSDDGLVHVTRDGGKTWTNVTPPTSPKFNMINSIDVNAYLRGGAYVVATSYKFGDNTPYIYRTTDYGKTWTVITSGIPKEEFVRVVRADPKRQGLLYAGTEKGMWISFDDGASWSKFQLNLPPVPIHDLAIKNDNLIAATHGRGFWMIDDLTPLHQVSTEMTGKEAVLFKPLAAYRMPGSAGERNAKMEGENHPGGAIIHYYVKAIDDKTEVKLEILEQDGKVIRSFSNKSKEKADLLSVKPGANRFTWNLRYPGYKTFPGMVYYGSPNLGPKAVPGTYKVRLSVNQWTQEHEFDVLKDPRIETTGEDLREQFEFLTKVRDKVSEANLGVTDLRKIKSDLGTLLNKVGQDPAMKDLADAIRNFEQKLTGHETNIHETRNMSVQDPLNYGIKVGNRLAHLMIEQGMGDFRPTRQSEEVRQKLTGEIDAELSALRKTIEEQVRQINQLARERGVEVINHRSGQGAF